MAGQCAAAAQVQTSVPEGDSHGGVACMGLWSGERVERGPQGLDGRGVPQIRLVECWLGAGWVLAGGGHDVRRC
jgi:hypothetical protein